MVSPENEQPKQGNPSSSEEPLMLDKPDWTTRAIAIYETVLNPKNIPDESVSPAMQAMEQWLQWMADGGVSKSDDEIRARLQQEIRNSFGEDEQLERDRAIIQAFLDKVAPGKTLPPGK